MKIPKIVVRYREACIDKAFKGSYDPATWPAVDEEFEAAQSALVSYIGRLRERAAARGRANQLVLASDEARRL